MAWIVPGSVKVCKGEKITKSLQYTIYFLQGKPGFTAFQFMEQRPVLDSQKHSRRVLPAAIDLSCTRKKGQTWSTFSKGAITARLLEKSFKFSFCSSHNGLQVFQTVLMSPLL